MREVADEVHYAGGVSDCNDVRGAWGAGFDGVIVGYALYVRGIRC
jgi:phosphoribosylformimino-5-aminoimidazole carboxamide ribotide isomerase